MGRRYEGREGKMEQRVQEGSQGNTQECPNNKQVPERLREKESTPGLEGRKSGKASWQQRHLHWASKHGKDYHSQQ